MNLLLGNLANLKAAVLPANLAERADWNTQITELGKGVAAAMQSHCNRLFERVEDDTFEFTADRSYVALPRFPVEEVTALDLKSVEVTGWVSQPVDSIQTVAKKSGIIEFGSILGCSRDRGRITYTGGFWVDYTEDNSGTQPAGSTAAPGDLIRAWHLQVQHEIESTNLLRGVAAKRPEDKGSAVAGRAEAGLLSSVKEILQRFVRYA